MSSKNENISNNENMSYEERIENMKNVLGTKFVEEAKKVLKDGKVLKGENAEKTFDTKLNVLTFEVEKICPLTYEEFKKEFPRTIELVETIDGGVVMDGVNKGHVIQGWSVRSNVDEYIGNIRKNVSGKKEQERQISLRNDVCDEIKRMEEEFQIDWTGDLFYKLWHIKEGEARWNWMVKTSGEKVSKKRIQTIIDCGGLEFLEVLQNTIYPKKK